MSEYKRPTVVSLLSRWLRCWRAASQQLIDPVALADAKLESTLTNENNKKLRYLIADLKSHVKLALPCELTRQNRHVHAGLNAKKFEETTKVTSLAGDAGMLTMLTLFAIEECAARGHVRGHATVLHDNNTEG